MTPEGKIKQHLVERIKRLGGDVRFARWIARRDCPDIRVMLPGRCCWVETKSPGEVPRPSQLREFAKMRACGEKVLVLIIIEEINSAFPI